MFRQAIHQRLDDLAPELYALSDFIYNNPELSHQEFKAQARLVEELERAGFVVETGIAGFETAFKATFRSEQNGPVIAFLAEYDALPELGHGCGHNLICTAAVGAARVLKSLFDQGAIAGSIAVIGTPAEEVPPPVKVSMIEQGVFNDVDVAMIMHGRDRTCTGGKLLAIAGLEFHFSGKSSHAAISPEYGISALDAALLTMHAIEMLREHVRADVRIHGIITDGGQAPNLVPEKASLRFYVRALDKIYLDKVVSRVENCARAGALATGAELTIVSLGQWDNRLNVESLNQLLVNNAAEAGAESILPHPEELGSSDFGTVTHFIPAATLYVELVPEGIPLHTREVVEAAGGEPGRKALLIGAKALALTAYDLLTRPHLLEQIAQEFQQAKQSTDKD